MADRRATEVQQRRVRAWLVTFQVLNVLTVLGTLVDLIGKGRAGDGPAVLSSGLWVLSFLAQLVLLRHAVVWTEMQTATQDALTRRQAELPGVLRALTTWLRAAQVGSVLPVLTHAWASPGQWADFLLRLGAACLNVFVLESLLRFAWATLTPRTTFPEDLQFWTRFIERLFKEC
ncbi:hypothetical protein [Deinococcus hohokamensis]|uniref:Uncharacterized protein n=1 Tax=Deinococcus hohokamensis TaxID=309883 RepID=A0ABV9IAP1_9DEIO